MVYTPLRDPHSPLFPLFFVSSCSSLFWLWTIITSFLAVFSNLRRDLAPRSPHRLFALFVVIFPRSSHGLLPRPPLGLSEYFLSVRSSPITLFKIRMCPQPRVLPILFSSFVCNTYYQLTSCTCFSFIYWLSSSLGCSFLEERDFCVSFIAVSPDT